MKLYNTNNPIFYELEQFILNCDEFYNSNYPICVFKVMCNEDCILYNTEQTTRQDFNFRDFKNPLIKEIWDYSEINIENFKKNGITNVKLVKPKIWNEYAQKLSSYNTTNDYEYDVVFVGWVQERREKILFDLKKENIKTLILSEHFLDERDKLISKSKILLNMHFDDDYKIFEIVRCFPWLDVNKIVVSENSLDNDERCINVNYNEIVHTIKKILNKS